MENKTIESKIIEANAFDEKMIMHHLRQSCGKLAENLQKLIPKDLNAPNRSELLDIWGKLESISNGANSEEAEEYEKAINIRNNLLK